MNTDDLVAFGRARFDLQAKKRLLREKYEASMLFAHGGGMWRAGPELINTLTACPEESAVIPDLYGVPVKISVPDMIMLAQQRWQEQMNGWLVEYQALSGQ